MTIAEIVLVIALADIAALDLADTWLAEISEAQVNVPNVTTINVRRYAGESKDTAMAYAFQWHDKNHTSFAAGKWSL